MGLFLFGALLSLYAHPVDKQTAKKIAKNFYSERMSESQFPGIASSQLISFHGINSYYIINIKNQKGFVLVSATDASLPVFGYSFHGSYSNNNQIENLSKTINQFNLQLEYIQKYKILPTHYISTQWKKYSNSSNTKIGPQTIGPLLTTTWSQGCYYNDSTPTDNGGPCNHVVTGCVATAMAQVLNYYQSPISGSGSHTYNSNYGLLTAPFGTTNYNWTAMSNSLNAQSSTASISAVAQLISHCGIAVDMNYSAGGSGAYSQNAANAFTHYFNYDNKLQLLHRANYVDSIWEQMVRTELDSMHPLYYDGSGSGGHAFVCDGYQGDHFFHFNWGWSGSYNGYFLLSALNPGGMNFSNYCGAVFGMKPGVPQSCNGVTDTLFAKAGNISDGSYAADYQNNTNCSWLISPANSVSISLNFFTFDLQTGDSLFIYDGSNNTNPLIGSYSGNSIPNNIASSGGQLFVQFISDNQNTSSGWSAYYRSEYCTGVTTITANNGTITDGSSFENYNDNTNCYWLLSNNSNQSINLEFTAFDTELSFDYVDIYDGSTTTANQLGSFSGNQIPQNLTSTGGNMLIHFHSDGGVTDQGWEALFYTCGIADAPYPTDSVSFCQGDSAILTIPNYVDSFLWQKDGILQPTTTNKQWTISKAGIYSYVFYSNNCPTINSDSVLAIVNLLPSASLGNDTTICDNQSISLNASSGMLSYLWSTGDTSQYISIDSSLGLSQNIILNIIDSNGCTNTDSISILFTNCTGLGEILDQDLKIFPNPVSNQLHIEFIKEEQSATIRVFDIQGHTVLRKAFQNTKSISLNTSNLSSGVYYLEVSNSDFHIIRKFIKR